MDYHAGERLHNNRRKEEYLKEFKEQAKILEEKFIVIEAIGLGESDRKIIEEVKTGVEGIKR